MKLEKTSSVLGTNIVNNRKELRWATQRGDQTLEHEIYRKLTHAKQIIPTQPLSAQDSLFQVYDSSDVNPPHIFFLF